MFVRIAARALRGCLPAILIAVPLSARAQTQTHSITLLWTAPGDDGTSGRATRYEMRSSTTDPSAADMTAWWNSSTAVTGLPYPSNSGTTDSVQVQLPTGGTYYFVLRAYDEVNNESGFSNVASGIPITCTIPAAAPQSFAADTLGGDALLSWSGTPDASATGLQVLRGTGSSGSLSPLTTLNPTDTSYRDTSVGNGTYRYQVRWVSGCGSGPPSSIASVTFVAPSVPRGPVAGVQARPNPSSGPISFVVTVPGSASQRVTLRLFDFTGRLMGVVVDGSYAPGEHTISWSRTSSSGNPVAAGYYELIGEIGPTRVRDRLVLLP